MKVFTKETTKMTDNDLKSKAGTEAASIWFIFSIIMTIVKYDWHHLFTFNFIILIIIGMFFSALTIGVVKYLLAKMITKIMYQRKFAVKLIPLFSLLLIIFEWGSVYILVDYSLYILFE